MDMDLAKLYGTPGAHTVEDQEKVAEAAKAELFVKLASENNIDVSKLNDEQINDLWTATFPKTAEGEEEKKEEHEKEETPAEEKKEEEKKESAAREFAAVQEWQDKVAEADKLGRIMAHSYVQELGSIGEAMDKEAYKVMSVVSHAGKGLERVGKKLVGVLEGKGKTVLEPRHASGGGFQYVTRGGPGGSAAMRPSTAKAVGAGAIGAGALGVGGVAAGAYKAFDKAFGHKKEGSAIDELAANKAVEKVAEAGWDQDEAIDRLNAIITLGGLGESEKIAAAQDVDGAVEIRALEFLEAAGYPVEWQK